MIFLDSLLEIGGGSSCQCSKKMKICRSCFSKKYEEEENKKTTVIDQNYYTSENHQNDQKIQSIFDLNDDDDDWECHFLDDNDEEIQDKKSK